MSVLKCTICGGELDTNSEMTVGVCQYCGSTIMIPKELEKRGNLYNRAVFLRQNNEFDKASSVFEDILKEDNSDAEAHWGLVLSKYGIEYVDDPKTGTKIPTCHRTQSTSILNDIDYKAAMEFASTDARQVIEKEANRISDIQKSIIKASQTESPYDIFICYKESDDLGNRTLDSTLAQDVYYELTKHGYKVFFARKSLESKLGSEYEPIIYAALNSAKVMIVIGTKLENYNSVWVRNEWSRFIEMNQDSEKTIIPAYRDMSPYELPDELSMLQSLDMSKIGFLQDLIDGIDKILKKTRIEDRAINNNISVEAGATTFDNSSLERFLQNGNTYLNLENYKAAYDVYNKITENYPEDYRGWWGLIVSKTQNLHDINPSELSYCNNVFGYVKKLAPPDEFEKINEKYDEFARNMADKWTDKCYDEERKLVGTKIAMANKEVDNLNRTISNLNHQIANSENSIKMSENSKNTNIEAADKIIQNELKEFKIGLVVLAVALLFLAWSIFLFGNDHGFWGVIVFAISGFLLFELFLGGKPPFEYNQVKAKNETKKMEYAHKHEQFEKEQRAYISEMKEQITSVNYQITQISEKIATYNAYLIDYKESIKQHWFCIKYKEFNYDVEPDKDFEEYRNSLLG